MTEILRADKAGVTRAAALICQGQVVSFGTETVYGLGGDATNASSIAAIFHAKGRPHFNPLICHYPSAESAFHHVIADVRARLVADMFWPGPLTLVLPRQRDCPVALLTGAGLDTLAVRVPAHRVAISLLMAAGCPVAAPSANLSGHVSPTSAKHVLDGLYGRIAAVLDSGPCEIGVESTVLDLSTHPPVLLRPGGITMEALSACLGRVDRGIPPGMVNAERGQSQKEQSQKEQSQGHRSPGLLASHYAPKLPVRLDAATLADDEVLLAFGPPLYGGRCQFQLSPTEDTVEAAARLFEGLRWLDAEGGRLAARKIAVMPIPDSGLGLAINDRLQRAAAPRIAHPMPGD